MRSRMRSMKWWKRARACSGGAPWSRSLSPAYRMSGRGAQRKDDAREEFDAFGKRAAAEAAVEHGDAGEAIGDVIPKADRGGAVEDSGVLAGRETQSKACSSDSNWDGARHARRVCIAAIRSRDDFGARFGAEVALAVDADADRACFEVAPAEDEHGVDFLLLGAEDFAVDLVGGGVDGGADAGGAKLGEDGVGVIEQRRFVADGQDAHLVRGRARAGNCRRNAR